MKIFDIEPSTWQELQTMTGLLFEEANFKATVSKVVQLVRGQKEIDVFVEDLESKPPSKFMCECKFWSNPIPQEVVHSFRTVVSDFGAHRGFIISKVGFQSGCIDASKNTNIELVTFDEVQEIFFDRWLASRVNFFMPYADRLFPYWDPSGGRMPSREWGDIDRKNLRLLIDAYSPFVDLGPSDVITGFDRAFPLEVPVINDEYVIIDRLSIKTHRQYFDFIDTNKDMPRPQNLWVEVL